MNNKGPSLFPDYSPDGIRRSAIFSPCRIWRYTLERRWDDLLPIICFLLLNPATADEKKDDSTNRRGLRFAREWGFGTCIFINLFAFRTKKPEVMKAAADPIGPENDKHILHWAEAADKLVLAWGTHGTFKNRDKQVLELLKGYECYHLGLTKEGHPKHPLYLKANTRLEKWKWQGRK